MNTPVTKINKKINAIKSVYEDEGAHENHETMLLRLRYTAYF